MELVNQHLSMSIAKSVKSKGYTVAFMHVPIDINNQKRHTTNRYETEQELVRL